MSSLDRFFSKINKTESCWEWTGSLTKSGGYAQFSYMGKPVRGHRWIYEQMIGQIPEGMQLDHLCRNRKCVNPQHLEPVTLSENVKRGLAGKENNPQSKKTHCPKGHSYSGTNKYGKRICRTCANEQTSNYYKRKRL